MSAAIAGPTSAIVQVDCRQCGKRGRVRLSWKFGMPPDPLAKLSPRERQDIATTMGCERPLHCLSKQWLAVIELGA